MSYITVVSGLPRSGTSLMMQMLSAGGVPTLVDESRPPDEDNPRGYFEYEPVKRTEHDSSWVPGAQGRAVKVIHALLEYLPQGFEYRVIFMNRPLAEILQSQRAMLNRSGKTGAQIPEERLAAAFEKQSRHAQQLMAKRREFRVLPVEYQDCHLRTSQVCESLQQFLQVPLDRATMAEVVDAKLYRNRAAESNVAS